MAWYKMFGFIKEIFYRAMPFLVAMNNQECKVRADILNINNNEPLFYPYSLFVNKYSGSCNNIMIYMLNYTFLMILKT